MNAYVSGMFMGSGLTLICLGAWLKYVVFKVYNDE